jgi:hypothetical protein
MTACPKCAYVRQPSDSHIHPGVCPQCGIAYQKYIERQQSLAAGGAATSKPAESKPAKATPSTTTEHLPECKVDYEEVLTWQETVRRRCLEVPERVDDAVFWARVIGWWVLLLLCLRFTLGGINPEALMSSFFHNMILPFHEFGHVLFRPFGNFMTILGGSLFQVGMPLGLMVAFIWKQRETYGAMVMLWWAGQSFIDLSPYVADAVARNLPLVGGASEEAHDWGNLLTMTQMLDHAQALARLCFGTGVLLMLIALAWGAYLLKLQYHRRASVIAKKDVDEWMQ